VGAEHTVKGGKTSKRGKVGTPKMRVLTFSDIENGLSCFTMSTNSLVESLVEMAPDSRVLTLRSV
jgi:hypothetical protein